jgi:hypothetical protein
MCFKCIPYVTLSYLSLKLIHNVPLLKGNTFSRKYSFIHKNGTSWFCLSPYWLSKRKHKIISVFNQTPTDEDVRESGCVVLTFLSLAINKDEGSVSYFGRFICRTKLPTRYMVSYAWIQWLQKTACCYHVPVHRLRLQPRNCQTKLISSFYFHSVFSQAALLHYKKFSKLMASSLTSEIVMSLAIL